MPTPTTDAYTWACSTNGALSDDQRRAMKSAIRRGYVDTGRGLFGSLRRRSGSDATLPSAPDSALTRLAEEAAADQGPALAGHGYRTWLIGAALAAGDKTNLDPELFYVASLLHDAGMIREVAGEDFTIRSAGLILDLCARVPDLDRGVGPRLADAVVAHASPGLTADEDRLGFYVQWGAMADLAGLRTWDLPRGFLAAAYTAHPRNNVHRVVAELIRREATDVPEGRFALLRSGGIDRLVQFSPTRFYPTPKGDAGS
ncbi:MAG TPA: hypothetical protein VKR22_00035 [Acidimicrobiales bacterium]|nr:hypothetical protein [Acidimicrobiales bacterium]